ncbi:MAG: hypothetical protein WC779_06205 [Candidatus Omnitrophota bacterium]|jgi:hypothetical protein
MRKVILTIIAVVAFTSVAFAAVSSPCSGYKKPKAPAEPREMVDTGHRRDVLDNRVPTESVKEGKVHMEQATQDRETLYSGRQ